MRLEKWKFSKNHTQHALTISNTILNNNKNFLHFFQEFKHTHTTNSHQYKQNQLILNTILHSCNCNKMFLKKKLLPSQKQLKRKVKVRKIKIIRRKKTNISKIGKNIKLLKTSL
jgi:hypothetical protein